MPDADLLRGLRPTPTAADRARAEAFVKSEYEDDPAVCRTWLANHRPDLVRMGAVAEMQKRQHAEWKARFAPEMAEAAE